MRRTIVVMVGLAGCGDGSSSGSDAPPPPPVVDSAVPGVDAFVPGPDAVPLENKVCLDGFSGHGTTGPVDKLATLTTATIELWHKTTAPIGSDPWHVLVYVHPADYAGGNYPSLEIGIGDASEVHMGALSGRVLEVGIDGRGGPQAQLDVRGFDLDATLPGFDEYQWHHYAVVYTGTSQRVFVDGTELTTSYQRDGSDATTFASAFGSTFTDVYGSLYLSLGYFARDAIRYTDGALSDLRVSDIARYTADFTPESPATVDANTVMLVPMDQADGSVSPDLSGSGYDVTWSGGYSWSGVLLGCP